MDWDKLRIFHAVAEAGSFTHAGETLNLSQSAVSRQISSLEESLNVPLFHRHARGLTLTEQGELLHRTVNDVFAKLSMTQAQLQESLDRPAGTLRVTTTVAFGSVWLTPRIKEFLEVYPDIELAITLSDRELDLGKRQADIALRIQPPKEPDLIQRHLGAFQHRIYASAQYLEENGTPQTIEELDQHRIIVYGEDQPDQPIREINWLTEIGTDPKHRRHPVLRVNNVYGIFRAVQSGVGIGALPEYMYHEASNLVRVLPEVTGPSVDVFFVYPEEMRHSKRIAAFRDFLLSHMDEIHGPEELEAETTG